MEAIKLLEEMFKLQQKLNDETNGLGWEAGYTNKNKPIFWQKCIYMECAELMDSFGWKHWKEINKTANWDNVTIEIVDIWHFLMSLIIEFYSNNNLDKTHISHDIASMKSFKEFSKEAYLPTSFNELEIMYDIEGIIHICSGFDIKISILIKKYFSLALKCGVNIDTLYKYYIGKNVLNKFRQDNGYKEGYYKKIWNGKEDNEVLTKILCKNLSFEEIYKKLESEYQQIK